MTVTYVCDTSGFKKAYLVAAILLLALQVGDIASTYYALNHGANELNPIAQFLIDTHLIIPSKILIVGMIIWGAAKDRIKHLWSVCAIWFIAGLYTMVVFMNLLHIWLAR